MGFKNENLVEKKIFAFFALRLKQLKSEKLVFLNNIF